VYKKEKVTLAVTPRRAPADTDAINYYSANKFTPYGAIEVSRCC